ncbi:MAG TPA: alpha/beta fold hydrolase [Phycisphaerales bacterium]|nr:alpha/beta fold hydrolase [Phycisphaerales bacterium]
MHPRFAKLPTSLAERSRTVRLRPGNIPALLCHPDWISPAPTVIWMHGRTANKELDAGRYIRWLKAGIAAVAFDLPGHGERTDARLEGAPGTLAVLAELIADIDLVVEALADPIWQGVFDLDRLGIGGMSLGGMAALRRLCDPHDFRCAAVECTTGDLWSLYRPEGPKPWGQTFAESEVAPLDPLPHIGAFKPIPLLALHSEADRIVPWPIQQNFLQRLREQYAASGAEPHLVRHVTWPTTGAPEEHSGFGRVGNDAKNIQTEFLKAHLFDSPAH